MYSVRCCNISYFSVMAMISLFHLNTWAADIKKPLLHVRNYSSGRIEVVITEQEDKKIKALPSQIIDQECEFTYEMPLNTPCNLSVIFISQKIAGNNYDELEKMHKKSVSDTLRDEYARMMNELHLVLQVSLENDISDIFIDARSKKDVNKKSGYRNTLDEVEHRPEIENAKQRNFKFWHSKKSSDIENVNPIDSSDFKTRTSTTVLPLNLELVKNRSDSAPLDSPKTPKSSRFPSLTKTFSKGKKKADKQEKLQD